MSIKLPYSKQYEIQLIDSRERPYFASVEVAIRHLAGSPRRRVECVVSVKSEAGLFGAADSNVFAAFRRTRAEMELSGLTALCYGASRDVHPSVLELHKMEHGLLAYKASTWSKDSPTRVVHIFDTGDDLDIGTVEEQSAYHRALWNDRGGSLKLDPPEVGYPQLGVRQPTLDPFTREPCPLAGDWSISGRYISGELKLEHGGVGFMALEPSEHAYDQGWNLGESAVGLFNYSWELDTSGITIWFDEGGFDGVLRGLLTNDANTFEGRLTFPGNTWDALLTKTMEPKDFVPPDRL